MVIIPGGRLASRPLHFIWIADCSGSMSINGKIQSLNTAIKESIPHMRDVADDNPNAEVLIRALRFSHGAKWHISAPTPIEDFKWKDLEADPLKEPEKPNVDIVFLVDTSGSMSNEIEGIKRSCVSFADRFSLEGANVRLGLVGFDIGGHRGSIIKNYRVYNLSRYTIGVWQLATPAKFKNNISSLSLGLFGGSGCYIADYDTVDIFPHVIDVFDKSSQNQRILVIISDEMGRVDGLEQIVKELNDSSIVTHVMGVPGHTGAHERIAERTGGKFWNIQQGKYSFDGLFIGGVAETVAKESIKKLSGGEISAGTDIGRALELVAGELKIPPMTQRALPPVLVLISDGQPTDDFDKGLKTLMNLPWGKKALRISIGIGEDADIDVLRNFIGHNELPVLKANNAGQLTKYIRWASTAVLKAASSPPSRVKGEKSPGVNVPIPSLHDSGPVSAKEVW